MKDIIQSYNESIKKYGIHDPRAMQWGTRRTQVLRFKILSEIGDIWDKSILDYGCGYGDLYEWLTEHGFRGKYIGYDMNRNVLTRAKKKHSEATFVSKPVKADYVLMSGVFGQKESLPLKEVITHAYRFAKKGLAYNATCRSCAPKNYERSDVPDFPFEKHWIPYVIRHDYRRGGFTVYVYTHQGVRW